MLFYIVISLFRKLDCLAWLLWMALLVLTIPDLQVEGEVTPGDKSQDTQSDRLLRTNGHSHLPYHLPPVRINISKVAEGDREVA